ncbi:MAG: fibro-slime domain-containing protein [Oscillospiraceae bacterium]|nr:fibro-slime domain-containing protein [Oscillospiraceae bacterium]
MKKDMAAFLQDLLKQNAKHRRMTAFFTALSLIVSSGVIWALHGVGVTMVNDADLAEESHVHSDTCYEQRLICGMDEDDTHKHTADCYVSELLSDADDSGQTVPEDDAQQARSEIIIDAEEVMDMQPAAEDEPSSEAETSEDETEPDAEDAEQDTVHDTAPANTQRPVLRAPGAGDGPGDPQVITTVDNIAEGIRFTLFDYGDQTLEGSANNYGETDHSRVKKTGINTGRDPAEDLMFFAYGTAPPHGEQIGEDAEGNPIYAPGMHDMNYYAGDYRDNSYQSGNRPFQGIVKNELEDGFPVLTVSDHTLAYLFNNEELKDADENKYKTVYQNVNHLLKEVPNLSGSGTHLVYNSNENYAYFNPETNNFEVYDRTFDIINDAHHKKNDVNNLKRDPDNQELDLVYDKDTDPGFKIGFFPFDEYNEELRDPNWNGDGYNHHFGMAMEAKFVNLEYDKINVKDPITFKYSGDDDMWVFVDGQLVLDIGGIHEPTGGMIDFSNDLVWVQDNDQGNTLAQVKANLFANQLLTVDTEKGETQDSVWNALPKPIGIDTASTTQTDGDKWIVRPISYYYPDWANVKHDTHTIKMFYMERGGCYSNLAMEMNLPTVKSLTVTKDVDFRSHTIDDFDNQDYAFQIYEKVINTVTGEAEWIIPTDIESSFTLKANGRKQFDNIGRGRIFKVVELGVNPQIYDLVSVNGSDTVLDPDAPLQNIESAANTVGDVSAYGFRNRIRENTQSVSAQKIWEPALAHTDPLQNYRIKFKLYRTDSVTGEKKPVALRVTENGEEKLKRTFILDRNNSWSWEASPLPARYGNHFFTYSVEELNTPKNYKAAYDTAPDGTLQITNTNQSTAELHVKKEWSHGGEKPVELVLKRKRIGYTSSEQTSLTVELFDESNNKISENVINDVYVGGSAEFALNVPDGVVLWNNQITAIPDSLQVEHDDVYYEVSNLAANSNTVQIHLKSDNADDELLVYYYPFTQHADNWSGLGNVRVFTSGYNPYAKGDALGVEHTPDTSAMTAKEGLKLRLDPAKIKPGRTYTFSVYIRTGTGSSPEYQLVFNDGLETGSSEKIIASQVINGAWTQLSDSVRIPENIDPYNMFIRIGTSADNMVTKYYIDEFTAVEGDVDISVTRRSNDGSDPGGVITIGSAAKPVTREIYSYKFTDELYDGWGKMGSLSISGTKDYTRIYERGASWASVNRDFNNVFKAGTRYKFLLKAQHDGADGTQKVSIVLHYKKTDGSDVYSGPVVIDFSTNTVNAPEQIIEKTGFTTLAEDADTSQANIYFGADDTRSFRIMYMKVFDLNSEIPGYTKLNEGVYQTNNSRYHADFDSDSVTNPLKLNAAYEEDTEFNNRNITVTLNSNNEWKYHWTNSSLNEEPDQYLYQYRVEEIRVGGVSVEPADAQGRIFTADGDYLVSYSGNDVAANTENSPMTVLNNYIWYKLPDTGGIGTDSVCAAGIMLAIGGFIGRIAYRKRERRNM